MVDGWEGEKEASMWRGYGGFQGRKEGTSGGYGSKIYLASPCRFSLVFILIFVKSDHRAVLSHKTSPV